MDFAEMRAAVIEFVLEHLPSGWAFNRMIDGYSSNAIAHETPIAWLLMFDHVGGPKTVAMSISGLKELQSGSPNPIRQLIEARVGTAMKDLEKERPYLA